MSNTIWGSGIGLVLAGLKQKTQEMDRLAADMVAMDMPGFVKTTQESSIYYLDDKPIGITIGDVQEVTDTAMENQLRSLAAQVKSAEALEKYVSSYLSAFGQEGGSNAFITSGNNVVKTINTVCSKGGDDPADRQAILDALTNHIQQVKTVADKLQQLRDSASSELSGQIPEVNQLLTEIAALNANIDALGATSSSIAYQRQRRVLLEQLAGYMEINVEDNTNSEFLIYTAKGRVLVQGSLAAEFIYTPSSSTQSVGTVTLKSVVIDRTATESPSTGTHATPPGDSNYYDRKQEAFIFDVTADFTGSSGGASAGIIAFLQGDAVAFGQALDAYAAGLRDSFNAVHNLSSAIAPRATLQGGAGYIGGASLDGTLAITGSGTLRIAVINTTTHLAILSADIDISGVTSVDNTTDNTSLCYLINNHATLNGHVTASIVNGALRIQTTDPHCGISLGSVLGSQAPTIALATTGSPAYGLSEFFHLNDVLVAPAAFWRGGTITGLAAHLSINAAMIANPGYFSINALRDDILGTAQAVSGDPSIGRALSDLFTRKQTNFQTASGGTTAQTLEQFSSGLVRQVASEASALKAEAQTQAEAYKQQEALFSESYGMDESEMAISSMQISQSMDLYFSFFNTYWRMMSKVAEMGS